jgi:hypothetical protein
MQYEILRTELQLPAYTNLSDQQAADAANASVVCYRPVPIAELASIAYAIGLPVALRVAIRTAGAPIDLVAVCESLLALLDAPFAAVDLFAADGTPDPASQLMLDTLQAAGLLSKDGRATLEALALTTTTRAAQLGLETVSALDVNRARGGVW